MPQQFQPFVDTLMQMGMGAGEDFFRIFMPLTAIGRGCLRGTGVLGHQVPAGDLERGHAAG